MLDFVVIASLALLVLSGAMFAGWHFAANKNLLAFLCWLGASIALFLLIVYIFFIGYVAGYNHPLNYKLEQEREYRANYQEVIKKPKV